MGKIVLVKFASSEEVIGEEVSITENTIRMKNVLAVMLLPTQGGTPTIGIGAWVPYRDQEEVLDINRAHIITTMTPSDTLMREYTSITSKIVQVQKPSLILPFKSS